MADGFKGAVSGGVAGLFAVFLAQQVGDVSLSSAVPSLELLAVGVGALAVVGGLAGRALGRRARRRAQARDAREASVEEPGPEPAEGPAP